MIDEMIKSIVSNEIEKVLTTNAILDCVLCIIARKLNTKALKCDTITGVFSVSISTSSSPEDNYTIVISKDLDHGVVKTELANNNNIQAGCIIGLNGAFNAQYARISDKIIRNLIRDIFNEIEDLPSSVVQEVINILSKSDDTTNVETPIESEPETPTVNETPTDAPTKAENSPTPLTTGNVTPPDAATPSIFDSDIYQKMLNNQTEPARVNVFGPDDPVATMFPQSML